MMREDEAREYWHVIRWDATSFLSMHEGRNSRLFYDKITSSFVCDVTLFLRAIVGKIARSTREIFSFMIWRRHPRPRRRVPYLLLIAPGIEKYQNEECVLIEACRARGIVVKAVHSGSELDNCFNDVELLSMTSMVTPRDYLWALSIWIWKVIRGLFQCCTGNRKHRNLFVAAIPGMWEYYRNYFFGRRIIADHGLPRLVFSLLPSSRLSIAVIDCMKERGVLTAAIRTQTTSRMVEHLVINADMLFCKSSHEKRIYEASVSSGGWRLEPGCLLSLPETYSEEPLSLPERYVLLLGTAPCCDHDGDEYGRYNDKLFQVAAATGMPVVFKGHDLAKEWDDAWFANRKIKGKSCLRIWDIRRNRELIDRASLVVSTPSTLFYYVISCGKPLVVVESKIVSSSPDEFQSAPICRIPWGHQVAMGGLDWNTLHVSSQEAQSWFENNYYLNKGSEYLVDFLLRQTESHNNRNTERKLT